MELVNQKIYSGSCFSSHNMVLLENGDLYSFGKNDFGQCGLGHTDDVKVPTKVMNNPNIVSIQLGVYHSVILENNGDLYVCGLNLNEEFGNQHGTNICSFVKIAANVKKVRASRFTMIQTVDDNIFFIGMFLNELYTTFTQIKIDNVKDFFIGSEHCLFLKNNGDIFVLGSNYSGQIGLGFDVSYSYFPHCLMNDKNVITICCGLEYTIIVTRDNETGIQLKCLGSNNSGELGFFDPVDEFDMVTLVDHPDVQSIFAGCNHTLLVKQNGNVFSTGLNEDGQLGLENNKNASTYTQLDLSGVVRVSSGGQHSIFFNDKGEVFVCGSNEWGQLGLDDNENRNKPHSLVLGTVKLFQNLDSFDIQTTSEESNENSKDDKIN